MKRKIYDRLLEWKEKDNGNCALLLDGARRVGKSYIAEQFGKNEYKSYILIDFAHLPGEVREVFENDLNDFRQYILVGGMPQAVEAYRTTKSFENADRIKKRILTLYRQDITKSARGYEAKVQSIFDEMPSQLSKTEKKYKLSSISKGARFRDYENAFLWLAKAMVINNCYNATEPTVGLQRCADVLCHAKHDAHLAASTPRRT